MKISVDDSHVELRPRQILRIDRAKGVRIVCVRGAVWVTQDEDLRDVILVAGDSFTLDRAGVALVSALEATSVRLEEPTTNRPSSCADDRDSRRPSVHAFTPAV